MKKKHTIKIMRHFHQWTILCALVSCDAHWRPKLIMAGKTSSIKVELGPLRVIQPSDQHLAVACSNDRQLHLHDMHGYVHVSHQLYTMCMLLRLYPISLGIGLMLIDPLGSKTKEVKVKPIFLFSYIKTINFIMNFTCGIYILVHERGENIILAINTYKVFKTVFYYYF